MTTEIPVLQTLPMLPFLNEGQIAAEFEGKVGIYAIFDQAETLQYVGYSRDIALSLRQHLVRQPQGCYGLKVQTIDRPNRTILESIRDAWIAENGTTPVGNGAAADCWNQPIDAKQQMTEDEQTRYTSSDDAGRIKLLKQVARRVEADVLAALEVRGVQFLVRFDPKAKEEGLLNLK
jgi:hypothetical protein